MTSSSTPYDASNETCERAVAELRIYGDTLDPVVVTSLLGVEPSSSQKKGERHEGFRGRWSIFKTGGWFLSSESRVESLDLSRHVDWLLAQLAPASEKLKALQAEPDVHMYIVCIWWSKTGDGGFTLSPEQMRLMAELNLECQFSLVFWGEDENEEAKRE